jgi:hypothetical protein
VNDAGAGRSQFKTFHIEPETVNRNEDSCVLALAQARPWLFEGFLSDGSVRDDQAIRSYKIPIQINN